MDNQFFASSRGIVKNSQIKTLLKTDKLRLLRVLPHSKINNTTIVGWGYKPTADKARHIAKQKNLPYWALEDGFISWLNHPSQSKPSQRLSYIIDKQGIYYDASKPSGIDFCLGFINGEEVDCKKINFDEARIEGLKQQLIKLKISKYNQARADFPIWLEQLKQNKTPIILLVDQTFNDASIEYSGGNERSFKAMFAWGIEKLKENSTANIILKVHPDVILGNKKGYLYELLLEAKANPHLYELVKRIHLLSEDVSPTDLIALSNKVATVSSQLGFEALWQNKSVSCFAWPFYAGRGLTEDLAAGSVPYVRENSTLNKLIHAALILYPIYLHPDTQKECEIEDILNYLQAHFLTRNLKCDRLLIPNVSLWKRSFIPEFIASSSATLTYGKTFNDRDTELVWGMKAPLSDNEHWRMEDGFIRSVGLGADLRRPTSLVLDDLGIYYNGKQSSRLEQLLNHYDMNDYEHQRTQKLLALVQQSAITKYNVESVCGDDLSRLKAAANGREVLMITGQYQQDLSMQYGTLDIKSNMALLQLVRSEFPDAFIIYKEHPDVHSGVRPGKLDISDVLEFANEYVANINITSLFNITDRVCTICSLSGFEALMRGIKVNTYGLPFYAGWGLTSDYLPIERRDRAINLNMLVYASLVLYPRYINWQTRSITAVESVIQQLSLESQQNVLLKTSWAARQGRKIRYLLQALLSRWGGK